MDLNAKRQLMADYDVQTMAKRIKCTWITCNHKMYEKCIVCGFKLPSYMATNWFYSHGVKSCPSCSTKIKAVSKPVQTELFKNE